jgi:hypothetical protein
VNEGETLVKIQCPQCGKAIGTVAHEIGRGLVYRPRRITFGDAYEDGSTVLVQLDNRGRRADHPNTRRYRVPDDWQEREPSGSILDWLERIPSPQATTLIGQCTECESGGLRINSGALMAKVGEARHFRKASTLKAILDGE